jgi:hypothetical protein
LKDDDTRVFLRTTERRTFANCRQAWWWSFVEGWEAIRTRPALRFGDISHQSLAAWYVPGRKRGEKPWLAFERIYKEQLFQGQEEFDVWDDDERVVDALELGIEMMKNYVDEYGDDDHIRVISSEMPFQVDVYDKHGKYMVTYVGSLDLVFEDMSSRQLGVIETKTAAAISTKHLGLDEQAGSYWAFAPEALQAKGLLKPGQDIDFILYNFMRKAFKDTRPRNDRGQSLNKPTKDALLERATTLGLDLPKRPTVEDLTLALESAGEEPEKLGEPSKSQPPPLFLRQKVYRDEADRENLMYRVRAQAYEMALVKAGKLPVYKNPGGTYPNQQCSGCEFADVCELHETGREWEELARLTMTTWDPYEDHRETPVTVTTKPRRKS